jgi:ribosomal-protein-alanine N-acetyltransferase
MLRIAGPSLELRLPSVDDVDDLYRLGRDPEVTRFFSWGPYERREEAEEYVRSLEGQRRAGTRLELVIAQRGGPVIGVTGLSDFSPRDRRAVVGTWLGREHWGTGANRDSKALILHLAFDVLGLQRVSALADPRNERSLRALEGLGFVREGVLESWQLHRGSPRDCAILRMTRAEYEARWRGSTPPTVEGELPEAFVAYAAHSS